MLNNIRKRAVFQRFGSFCDHHTDDVFTVGSLYKSSFGVVENVKAI